MTIEISNAPFPSDIPSSGNSFITIDGDQLKSKHSDGSIKIYSEGITSEQVMDIVGGMLLDTATIDLTYDDVNDQISAIVKDNSISNSKLTTGIDAAKIADGSVSNTEFQYINSVTSNVQTQINNKENTGVAASLITAQKGVANGIATLDATVKVPLAQIPSGINHSTLSNLSNDDHPQYHNDTRGDVRYYTKTQSDLNYTPLSHVGTGGSSHALATVSTAGFMSPSDKTKIDAISNPIIYKTTVDLTSSSNTVLTNITELNQVCLVGKTYRAECWIRYQSANSNTGIVLTISAPSGTLSGIVIAIIASDGNSAAHHGNITFSGDLVIFPSVPTANVVYLARMEYIFVPSLAGTGGNMFPQFRSEVNGSVVTVLADSILLINEIGPLNVQ
jgi:hypothetical protein